MVTIELAGLQDTFAKLHATFSRAFLAVEDFLLFYCGLTRKQACRRARVLRRRELGSHLRWTLAGERAVGG